MRADKHLDEMFFGTVTVGERGQIVIPAEARAKYDINAGEKLLVFAHPGGSGFSVVKMSGVAGFIETLKQVLAAANDDQAEGETEILV